MLETGPLLLTCEKILPQDGARGEGFDRQETRQWIGFFLEALDPPVENRVFTCRVRYLGDFWAANRSMGLVKRAARREGVAQQSKGAIQNRCGRIEMR